MGTSVGMGEVGGTNYGLLGLTRALSLCAALLPTAVAFFFNVPHRALHHAHRLCYVLLRIICYCSVYKFYCYVLVSIASISISLLKYVWHFHPRLKLAAVLRECLPWCWSFLPSLAGHCMFTDYHAP
uniref:Putative secreted protein n=1 Tax=Ixodes ricinus TaxID=34613 RepID=A0A6B0UPT3_IXORI